MATQPYTTSQLERALKKESDPTIQQEILLEQVRARNPAVYHFEPKGSTRHKVINKYLDEIYPEPRRFSLQNPLAQTTRSYYKKPDEDTLERVTEALLEDSRVPFNPQEKKLIRNTTEFILQQYDKSEKPMMELTKHHTAEHSLDAAKFTLLDTKANVADVVAALLHDWIEDCAIPTIKKENPNVSEQKAIVQAKEYAFKQLRQEDEKINYELLVSIEAVDLMTIRRGYDYATNINQFSPEFSRDRIIEVPEHHKAQFLHNITPNAYNAKCGDKDTGVRTWQEFSVLKQLKTAGKTMLVENNARIYTNNPNCQRADTVRRNTQRLAISTRRELRKVFSRLQRLLKTTDEIQKQNDNKTIQQDIELLNQSIDDGLLWSFDTADTIIMSRERDFRRTAYTAFVLGITPDHNYQEISQLLVREGEDTEQTLHRLKEERKKAEQLLLNEKVRGKADISRLAQRVNRQELVRTIRRVMAFERQQTAYALDPEYYVEFEK